MRVAGPSGFDFCVTYKAGRPTAVAMMAGRDMIALWQVETIDRDGLAAAAIRAAEDFLAQFRLPAVAS